MKEETKGIIKYFDLVNWWLETFSAEERDYIEKIYQAEKVKPHLGEPPPLIVGDIRYSDEAVTHFLLGLASLFPTVNDLNLVNRIRKKAEELIERETDILVRHFYYHNLIESFYGARRDNPEALNMMILPCEKQISLSPNAVIAFRENWRFCKGPTPGHTGFSKLIEVFFEQGRYEDAILLAKQAKSDGWAGYWDVMIERFEKMGSGNGVPKIFKVIKDNPGILQTELYRQIDLPKDVISSFLYNEELKGKISRTKKGKTYELRLN